MISEVTESFIYALQYLDFCRDRVADALNTPNRCSEEGRLRAVHGTETRGF